MKLKNKKANNQLIMKTTLLTFTLCFYSIISFSQDLVSYKDENGKYGYKDKEGDVVILAQYDDVDWAFDAEQKLARVQLNEKYGFINHEGKRVIDIIYEYSALEPDENGLIKVTNDIGKDALIDQTGKTVLDFKYDALYHVVDTLYKVELNGKEGIISLHGNEIVPIEYNHLGVYGDLHDYNGNKSETYLLVTKDYINWGVIDFKGRIVIPFEYDWFIEAFGCSGHCITYHPVMLNRTKKWSYSDKHANFLTDFKYDWAGHFMGNIAPFMIKNKYGFLNKNMNEICPAKYDDIGYYALDSLTLIPVNQGAIAKTITEEDGYTWVERKGGKWGFINQQGKEVISVKYDSVELFRDGVALVQHQGKWGIINEVGKEVLKCSFNNISNIKGGGSWISKSDTVIYVEYRTVSQNNKVGLLTKDFELVGECIYDEIETQWGQLGHILITKKDGKFGYINLKSKKIIVPKYDEIRSFYFESFRSEILAKVKLNSKFGYIDEEGNEVIPPIYEDDYYFFEGKAEVTLNGRTFYIDKNGNEIKE
jgi:hypothetical protein